MTKPPTPGVEEDAYEYKWDINGQRVWVSTADLYGYWQRFDGSEGGGLWWSRDDDGKLNLIDYDGGYSLPKDVIDELRGLGLIVSEDFE